MASHKIAVQNIVGNMTVLTMSVATKELYTTMVLRGSELFDVEQTVDVKDAQTIHEYFVRSCEAFQKMEADRAAYGREINTDKMLEELENDLRRVEAGGRLLN